MVGFLLLAFAAIGILTAVGVVALTPPALVCGPQDANESAAVATLKNVHSAQSEFAARTAFSGYGSFPELCGLASLREVPSPGSPPLRLGSPLLGDAFGSSPAGRVSRSGYCFQIWLQTADGRWVGDGAVAEPTPHWCAYAWPSDSGKAKRAFFVDEQGNVWANANRELHYFGAERPVPIDAALPSSDAHGLVESNARSGRDGQTWVVVN